MASLLGPVAGNTAQADKSVPATTTAKPDRSPPSETRLDSGAITDRPRTVNRTNASAKYAGFIVLSPAFRCASFEPTLVAFPTSIGQKQYSQPHLHRNPIGRLSRVKEVNDLLTGVLQHSLQLRHSGSGNEIQPNGLVRFRPDPRSSLSNRTFPEGVAGKLRFAKKNAGSELRAALSQRAKDRGTPLGQDGC